MPVSLYCIGQFFDRFQTTMGCPKTPVVKKQLCIATLDFNDLSWPVNCGNYMALIAMGEF